MMHKAVITKWGFAATAFFLAFAGGGHFPAAGGCTLCINITGSLWGIHPQSISVAVAIRKEIESGAISEKRASSSALVSAQVLGFRMRKLVNDHHRGAASLEMLVIESGVRFRIDPSNPKSGFVLVKAGEELPPPAVRWVTGQDVLHAFLDRRMTVAKAVERGLLFIEKPAPRNSDLEAG